MADCSGIELPYITQASILDTGIHLGLSIHLRKKYLVQKHSLNEEISCANKYHFSAKGKKIEFLCQGKQNTIGREIASLPKETSQIVPCQERQFLCQEKQLILPTCQLLKQSRMFKVQLDACFYHAY